MEDLWKGLLFLGVIGGLFAWAFVWCLQQLASVPTKEEYFARLERMQRYNEWEREFEEKHKGR